MGFKLMFEIGGKKRLHYAGILGRCSSRVLGLWAAELFAVAEDHVVFESSRVEDEHFVCSIGYCRWVNVIGAFKDKGK